jgi:hypothetical protein
MAALLSKELSIASKVTLLSGHEMPLLGLGVFQNTGSSVVPACLAGFEAGYRHIDSAQFYRNEAEVAEAIAKSGLKRDEVFVSEYYSCSLIFVAYAVSSFQRRRHSNQYHNESNYYISF